ncbi:MAG TPA: hypothetical protein VG838_02595 [Opitutaceae bacterium]|nr:hypothetical protein [Opitutaceae bacterium]
MPRLTVEKETLKQLALRSRNQCAFPECIHPIMDGRNVLVGELCHIEAAEPGGERYNPNQTDEERRAFENLLYLCHGHHKVTDDVVTYTVAVMKEMKRKHEALPPSAHNPDQIIQSLAKLEQQATLIAAQVELLLKQQQRTERLPVAPSVATLRSGQPQPESVGLRDEAEPLFPNLFAVEVPETMNTAKVIRKRGWPKFPEMVAAAWKAVSGTGDPPVGYWSEDGILHTYEDLNAPVWKELFRRQALQPYMPKKTADWSQSRVLGDSNKFIKLLNRTLEQHCMNEQFQYRLRYAKAMKCFLFQADPEVRVGYLRTQALKAEASRMVFRAIPDKKSDDPKAIQHWQHEAFRYRFYRFGGTWYLVVTPFWAFTGDGMSSPSRWQKTSSSNMRKPERNRAVLGHVMFWASVLCREPDLIRTSDKFRISRPVALSARPAIWDSDWVKISNEADRRDLEDDMQVPLPL